MRELGVAAVALLGACAGSELALRGMKLQTGLGRLVVVWMASYAAAAGWFARHDQRLVSLTILWAGAFLAWFGVRSHIESSILLRMLHLLRPRPMTEGELVCAYTARYGEAARIAELRRGGLIADGPHGLQVTRKGNIVLRLASVIR